MNLKWDNLYVYYLRSFKHLCGIFFNNWFDNRMGFALANLAALSKYASWYLNRGPGDNHMKFFSSKQKSTFVIYGGPITFPFFLFLSKQPRNFRFAIVYLYGFDLGWLQHGETIFYGVLFSRFQKANMNFQHINFWWLHEIYHKEFSMNKESDKDEDESWILCTISLQINVISQQKIKKMKLPVHKTS